MRRTVDLRIRSQHGVVLPLLHSSRFTAERGYQKSGQRGASNSITSADLLDEAALFRKISRNALSQHTYTHFHIENMRIEAAFRTINRHHGEISF